MPGAVGAAVKLPVAVPVVVWASIRMPATFVVVVVVDVDVVVDVEDDVDASHTSVTEVGVDAVWENVIVSPT